MLYLPKVGFRSSSATVAYHITTFKHFSCIYMLSLLLSSPLGLRYTLGCVEKAISATRNTYCGINLCNFSFVMITHALDNFLCMEVQKVRFF